MTDITGDRSSSSRNESVDRAARHQAITGRVMASESIPALVPRDESGFQFVCYADCCSGVSSEPHEVSFAAVNDAVRRLKPQPEFICFPGDEIRGLTCDEDQLREQWRYWLENEMGWLDRHAIPIWHTPGNHTCYDRMSERVFREVHSHHAQNGPAGQEGLSYYLIHKNLLAIFVNTLNFDLGGEGRLESTWLAEVLENHSNIRDKIIFGHHPVFPVNGFSGAHQREINREDGQRFWRLLVKHGVLAYFCSHILAFDVQVHRGVLQVLTAGAGTSGRMPEQFEYLHTVQAAVDSLGLRYQVLDESGQRREELSWPFTLPQASCWPALNRKELSSIVADFNLANNEATSTQFIIAWQFSGRITAETKGQSQTLLCGYGEKEALPPVWIGLTGSEQRLSVLLSPVPGESPHLWLGPTFTPGEIFSCQLVIHTGMGPGGIIWRAGDNESWSSLSAASPWGAERLHWPLSWNIGFDQSGETGRPFRGAELSVQFSSCLAGV